MGEPAVRALLPGAADLYRREVVASGIRTGRRAQRVTEISEPAGGGFRIRPLDPADAPAAADVVRAAFAAAGRSRAQDSPSGFPARAARWTAIIGRLAGTDPDGCFLAVHTDGAAVGVAASIRRGPLWGLSLLFVRPDLQGGGLGRQLLDVALTYADGAQVRIIQATDDPRAVRLYAAAGLAVHPAMSAEGTVPAGRVPAGLPPAVLGDVADLGVVDAVDARLRGSSRRDDVEHVLTTGGQLLVDPDGGGFAVQQDGRPLMIGARDEATAARLLWQCFARATGSVTMRGMTASQGWAMRVCLDAGLPLRPGGPVCLSGIAGLPGPYYPSGIYF